MPNKNTLKNILEEKINKKNIYDTVISKKEKQRKNLKKWILAPICILALFLCVVVQEKSYVEPEKKEKIEINEIEESKDYNGSTNSNSNTKTYSSQKDTVYIPKEVKENIVLPFKIKLPKNVVKKKNLILYQKEEIYGYQIIYENASEEQSILFTIFTEKIKKAEGKPSVIQNIEYIIQKAAGSSNRFIVQWDYKEQTISMETINFKEEEIIEILKTMEEAT